MVVPGVPHHVTQRGNRRQKTFFNDADYRLYKSLMAEWCRRHCVDVWAYCLMPNHIHLIAVPSSEEGLRMAIGEAHRRYTQHVNRREGWTGHLWQGRFASFPMDQRYLLSASRYVELNPVRAGLVASPEDYPWSSTTPHLMDQDDGLVKASPLLSLVEDWWKFISEGLSDEDTDKLRKHQRTGRPLGNDRFIKQLESTTQRMLQPRKPGRKTEAAQN